MDCIHCITNNNLCIIDITGFTAWSSVREPTQVFTLLETVYGHFDDIAKTRKIFKGMSRLFGCNQNSGTK